MPLVIWSARVALSLGCTYSMKERPIQASLGYPSAVHIDGVVYNTRPSCIEITAQNPSYSVHNMNVLTLIHGKTVLADLPVKSFVST